MSVGGSGAPVAADGSGHFVLPNAVLSLGTNTVTLTAADQAGNAATAQRVLSRVAPQTGQQVALDWNNQVLNAIQADASDPEFASRALAMASAAVYDAVNSVTGASSFFYVHVVASAGSSDVAAVAQAAHDALVYLYPAQQAAFDAQLATSLASVAAGAAKTNGVAVGQQVAAAIVARRQNDGAHAFKDYTPGTGPGVWQPTYPMYMTAESPQWAALDPFLIDSVSQFRPAGPPDLASARWQSDYNQIKSLGAINSAARTADQTLGARFWNDPTGTATPPGHWNIIANQVAAAKNLTLGDAARMFAEMNVAMADSAVAGWDAKFAYNFWRPITAIPAGGGNAALAADASWKPLLTTPPHPEYVSGHSTFSAAAAAVLDAVFGPNTPFTVGSTSPGMTGVTRSFSGFDQAATEAAMSRVYGGIHFNSSVQDGLTMGTAVGRYVLQKFADTADTAAPTVTVANAAAAAVKFNASVAGLVTDNLSGVRTLTGRFDAGPTFDVTVDANGRFTVTPTLAVDGTADGAHVLHLTAADYAGNVSTPVDYAFTLDTKAPTVTVTGPAGGATMAAGATLSGIASGTGSSVAALGYRFDGGTSVPISFGADGLFGQMLDVSRLAPGSHSLTVSAADAAGNVAVTTLTVLLAARPAVTVSDFTPAAGSGDVGATFRPQVFFARPINVATLDANDFFLTDTTGAKVATTIVPADDGTYAWLFPTAAMPGASTMTVTVDGTKIRAADGAYLDAANAGGTAGSKLAYTFSTVSTASLPGTSLSGVVADPGPDRLPSTKDDVTNGTAGLGSADDAYKLPIAGVKVSIVGTSLTATTNAAGAFSFATVPAGDLKLEVDGTTATNAPAGYYFPQMVMDLNVLPGVANTVMAAMQGTGSGNAQPGAAAPAAKGVYLPRVATSILKTVSATGVTTIGVDAKSSPNLTGEQRQQVSLSVPGGVAIGTNGQKMSNVQVGISFVPPQLVMDMLPPGLMQLSATITIQAPGVAEFATPLPLSFPNLYGAVAGSKLNFYSYDHTAGRLVIEGTATVSADGVSATTDPGTGITHPGWHGLTPPGRELKGKADPSGRDPDEPDDLTDPDDPDCLNLGPGSAFSDHGKYFGPNAGLSEDVVRQIAEPVFSVSLPTDAEGTGDYYAKESAIRMRLPAGMTPESLLNELLLEPDDAVRKRGFTLQTNFTRESSSSVPKVGDLYKIRSLYLYPVEVVLADLRENTNGRSFTFVTLKSELGGVHPFLGAREIGFRRLDGGIVEFFNRGVSRFHDSLIGDVAHDLEIGIWNYELLTQGLGERIERDGGQVVPYPKGSDGKYIRSFPDICLDRGSGANRVEFGIESLDTGETNKAKLFYYKLALLGESGPNSTFQGVSKDGNFSAFVGANTDYTISIFDPASMRFGTLTGSSGQSGNRLDLGSIPLAIDNSVDPDGDGV